MLARALIFQRCQVSGRGRASTVGMSSSAFSPSICLRTGFTYSILSQKTWSSLRAVGLRAGSCASRRSRRRGSETIGYTVNPATSGTGMMEYWKVGMLGLAELDLFLLGWHGSEYKIRPSSVFDSQYSIIPPFHYSTRSLR